MLKKSANAPSSTTTTTSSKTAEADYEPDDEWKLQLRKRIEGGLQSMVADVKENQAAELRKSPDTPETRLRIENSYKQAMQTIKGLATEQYLLELDRERNKLRWTAGVPMNSGWTQYFIEEQQNIMNSIKQSSNEADNSTRTVRIRSPSCGRDEPLGNFRRGHRPSTHEKPALPDNWRTTDAVEEHENVLRPAPSRIRLSSTDRPPHPSPVPPTKWDSSMSKSSGSMRSIDRRSPRSPPGPPPEVWKPAISPAEDALLAKTYKLQRRAESIYPQQARSPPNVEPFLHRTHTQPPPSYHNSPHVEHPTFGDRETNPWNRGNHAADADDEYNSDEDTDPEESENSEDEAKKVQNIEARRKLEESRKEADDELRRTEIEIQRLADEEARKKRDEEEKRKEEEAKRREEAQRKKWEEAEKKEAAKKEETKRMREDAKDAARQQAEFRKREEDIRRAREGRKGNYGGSNSARSSPLYFIPSPGTSSGISRTPQFIDTPILEGSAAVPIWAALARGPSIKPTASSFLTANPSSTRASTGKTRIGSVSPVYSSETEGSFERGFARCEEEKERQLESEGRPFSREELQQIFENHERLWDRLNTLSELSWTDFPWPMTMAPSNSDDMSLPLIAAYIQSPAYPDKNQSRTTRDRIKEYIRRWHPDRFMTELLPKVIQDERENVKLGAENVESYLRALLMKENDNNNNINIKDLSMAQRENEEEERNDDHPTFGGQETDSWHHGNSAVDDKYDSDEDTDSEDSESSEDEAKKMRDIESKRQNLEESRREGDDELRRTEVEIQRLAAEDARKKKDEEDKGKEEERKEEEVRRKEEEALKKEEEARRKEEERKEEEATKKEEEARRMVEEAKEEEEAKRKEREAKKKEELARRKEEEAKRKAEELSRKEEEIRQTAAKLEEDTERTKRMQLEAQKIAEDALKIQQEFKKMEEEVRRKDTEIREIGDILHRREEEAEIEAKRIRDLETKMQKLEEDKREADRMKIELQRLIDEAAREDEKKRKEEERKEEEARRREEDVRKKEEEIHEKEEEVKRREQEAAKKEQDTEKREDSVKREEEEAMRKAEELSKKEEEVLQRTAKIEEDTERARHMQLEAQKIHEDVKKLEEEARKKETEMKEWAAQLQDDTEKTKRIQLEAQRITEEVLKKHEDVEKMEEEARKKEAEMREWAAQLQEETEKTKQMQLETQKLAEDALKKHEDVKKMEEEVFKKETEMREWATQLEEDSKKLHLEAQRITEDALKKQDDPKEMDDLMRREVDSLRVGKGVEKVAMAREEPAVRGGNTFVAGGTFYKADMIRIDGSGKSPTDKGITKLLSNAAPGAFHDSRELSDPLIVDRHPNNRVAAIQEIFDWLDDPKSELVMWLHGATGAGKSAIAQTIAQMLFEQGRLSGSFFFARGSTTGRADERRLVPSLAYQLAGYLPDTRFHIATTVVSNPVIFDLALGRQVRDLLINPLGIASNAASSSTPSRLFIMDGLDECRDADTQLRILQVFATAVESTQHRLPHKLLITSRSEMHLLAGFNNTATTYRQLSLDNFYRLSG